MDVKEVRAMNYQTAEQLSTMKLHAMRLEYARQDELPASEDLSFDDVYKAFNYFYSEEYESLLPSQSIEELKSKNEKYFTNRCYYSK